MDPNKRFEENMPLVGFVFQKYFKNSEFARHYDDLMQEGYVALWRSCCQFNESLGFQFSTYAGNSILYAMQGFLRKENKVYEKIISIETVVADDGEGNEVCILDTLFDTPEDTGIKSLVEFCISLLEDLEQRIIRSILEDRTQEETAAACGTSQSSVSRCLSKFRKLVKGELQK